MGEMNCDPDVEAALYVHDKEMNGDPAQRAAARLCKTIAPALDRWFNQGSCEGTRATMHAFLGFTAGVAVSFAVHWARPGTSMAEIAESLNETFSGEIARAVKQVESGGAGIAPP